MQTRSPSLLVDSFIPVNCSLRAWNGEPAEVLDPTSAVLEHCG